MTELAKDKTQNLARRAVACEGWRWMEGMSTTEGDIVVGVGDDTITLRDDGVMHAEHSGVLPDLNDPATLGCLLELVREALGLFGVSTHYNFDPPHMWWQVLNPVEVFSCATAEMELRLTEEQAKKLLEAGALIAALEDTND